MTIGQRMGSSMAALVAIVIVVAFVFSVLLFSLLAYEQQHDQEDANADLRHEATALGLYLKDAALRNDFQNIQAFVTDWGRQHEELAMFSVSAPNGFVIARFESPHPAKLAASVRHEIRHDGRLLVIMDMVHDISGELAMKQANRLRLLPWVVVFLGILSGVLWLAVRRLVLVPMQQTDTRLTETAAALALRNTELRDTLVLAEQANRSKSQFLAAMSHELRTPLNAIIGFSQVIRDEHVGKLENEKYRDYAGSIHDSGQHLLELINDVLDVAKIESGSLQLQCEDVPLNKIVHAAERMVREQAVVRGLTFDVVVPSPSPVLHVDERRIKQVILNLFSNAVKFTESGGRIAFRLDEGASDGGIAFVVEDTGIGMSAEGMEKALSPFGQVDSDLNRRFPGTGLGLPLSQELAELHGGTLTISSAPGTGTAIRIWLPSERIVAPATASPSAG